MTEPAEASLTPAPDQLRLVSILVSGLPLELGTPEEPARYTVPAVFSRQVTALERTRIEDPATALALHAGPDLALEVSDRRLLIKNTTLAELEGGLAAALAATLRDIDRELGVEEARLSAVAEVRVADERDREAAIAAAVAAIHFE
ncbi:MAG TPA: hypothetical protein VGC04_04035 [Cellulomonas sp.]